MWNSTTTVREAALKTHAFHVDFKKFFQQMSVAPGCRAWTFESEAAGIMQSYELLTVPTGARIPPLLAQTIARAIGLGACRLAMQELGVAVTRADSYPILVDTMIDNIRLCSDDYALLCSAWHHLLALIARCNITVGDALPPAVSTPKYTYLGIEFAHRGPTRKPRVALSEKTLSKLRAAVDHLRDPARTVTLRAWMAWMGLVTWTATVLQHPNVSLAECYLAFKFTRRRARKSPPLDEDARPWPCAVRALQSIMKAAIALRSAPVSTRGPMSALVCYTDASPAGAGVCVFGLGHPICFGIAWSAAEALLHINILELKAVLILHRFLVDVLPFGVRGRLWIDNTSAQCWVSKGRSHSFLANNIARDITKLAASIGLALEAGHIASEQNPADNPSRNFPV